MLVRMAFSSSTALISASVMSRSAADDVQDRLAMPLDSMRAPVPAQRTRPYIALLALQLAPAADAGRAHAEPLARLAMRQTRRHRRQNPNPKIDRQSFRHACRPPNPAISLNQIPADLGIPFNSISSKSALDGGQLADLFEGELELWRVSEKLAMKVISDLRATT